MVFSGTTQRFIHPQIGKFMQMMKKKPLQQFKSKVTSSLQRLIESIDYALITKGGEGNELAILKEILIRLYANKWKEMIWEEYTSLKKNKTWVLTKLANGCLKSN
jgi:hypothetical protein